MISTALGFVFKPTQQWQKIASTPEDKLRIYILYPIVLGLIPAIAWYYGTTNTGWTIGDDDTTYLTANSALKIAVLFYLAQLFSIWVIGLFIHWMADTYAAESTPLKGIVVAGFTTTPFMLAGVVGFIPVVWFDIIVALAAIAQSVYLLYIGIPIAMRIPEEQGFLYASAMVAVGMVILICLMCAIVILWDMGFAPSFTD